MPKPDTHPTQDDFQPNMDQIHAAALKWCGEKPRETFPEDIHYFFANWRHTPGMRAYVERECAPTHEPTHHIRPPAEHRHRRWHWLRHEQGWLYIADWRPHHGWNGGWDGRLDADFFKGWTYVGPVNPDAAIEQRPPE